MLDLITMGRIDQAWKVLIHGPPGVGKTWFANTFPKVVAADLEGSTERYDMARLDLRNAPLEVYDERNQVDKTATSVMNFLRTLGS
jgi:GTPase SAR1 family protein